MPRKTRTQSFGSYGSRVRLFWRGKRLSVQWWDPGRSREVTRSLGHGNWDRGKQDARELSRRLEAAEDAPVEQPTLDMVFSLYEREALPHKVPTVQSDERRSIDIWTHVLGGTRDVMTIDFPTLDRFVRDRRAGRIRVPGRKLRPCGARAIECDLVFLNVVFNWARTATVGRNRLLERNPIEGYKRPKSTNVSRPVATYDRFLKVLEAADEVDPQGLFKPFLVLIESLGWRVSAVCGLRASDVDRKTSKKAPFGRLHKRGELDKEGVAQWVPLSEDARAAIDLVLERNPVIGDLPLFPSPRVKGKSWSRWHARDLLEKAEAVAEVPHLEGGAFHPYRRKWATERKHLPIQDVMAAGGWRDRRSVEQCYQHADEGTILKVVTEPQKLREA